MEYEKTVCPIVDIDGKAANGKQFDLDITIPDVNKKKYYCIRIWKEADRLNIYLPLYIGCVILSIVIISKYNRELQPIFLLFRQII